MSTETDAAAFAIDDEVTVTVTGRVVAGSPGGIVVEYLTDTGFPERIAVRPHASVVTVAAAVAPSAEEIQRRRAAYRLIGDAFSGEPEERSRVFAEAPYGGVDV